MTKAEKLQLVHIWFNNSIAQYEDHNLKVIEATTDEERFAIILINNLIEHCPLHTILDLLTFEPTAGKFLGSVVEARQFLTPEMRRRKISEEYAFYLVMIRYIDVYIQKNVFHPSLITLITLRSLMVEHQEIMYLKERSPIDIINKQTSM